MSTFSTHSVSSADGTPIGYRQIGSGPGLILVHGGMEASQHFTALGEALADNFTVYIPDRRGRGMSGGFGDNYSVARDCEDIAAIVKHTGAQYIFGLSSGALIALRATLVIPALTKAVLYEPPLSVNGSSPTAWLPRYEREVAAGQFAQALVTVLKGIPIAPKVSWLPRFVLVPLVGAGISSDKAVSPDVSIKALIPTQRYDMTIVKETADTLDDYRTMPAQVLLLGGSKSPMFLKTALAALETTLPHVTRRELSGFDHLSATNEGRPEAVAGVMREFLQ